MQSVYYHDSSPGSLLFQFAFGTAGFNLLAGRFIHNPRFTMTSPSQEHIPVLMVKVLQWLITDENGVYFDGTLGDGGHSRAISRMLGQNGRVIAADWDRRAVQYAETWLQPFGASIAVFHQNFCNIAAILKSAHIDTISGILLDLGLSSRQLEDAERGFSYRHAGPLDMRMDDRLTVDAFHFINNAPAQELRTVFFRYGEERDAARLVKIIIRERAKSPVATTADLTALMKRYWRPKNFVKSASRIFQALRIAVNRELENLERFLDECWQWLAPGGRIAIISYHSLEDRMVKQAFKKHENPCICPRDFPVCRCGRKPDARILTRKPIKPSPEEIDNNPRARSAKLRIAEKVPS